MDFLLFKTFISPIALIMFYYLGAILMPLFIWFATWWFIKKFYLIEKGHNSIKKGLWTLLSFKYKMIFTLFFIMLFLFMQLLWRMMFEFLIAYMQIREALVG